MQSLLPTELLAWMEEKRPFRLVDVREPEEWELCRLPGAEWIPLGEFSARAGKELKKGDTVVLYCHHGVRSGHAQQFLASQGFEHTVNLIGGIDRWACEVAPEMARY